MKAGEGVWDAMKAWVREEAEAVFEKRERKEEMREV